MEDKAAAILPEDVISGLASSNWKERLAAMEKFTEVSRSIRLSLTIVNLYATN